jgi:hypothetical protein
MQVKQLSLRLVISCFILLLVISGVTIKVSADSVIGSTDSDVVKIKEIINKLFTNFYV